MKTRSLGQKIHLAIIAAMILIFGAITIWNGLHKGFRFRDSLLKVSQTDDGALVYRGKADGELVTATVTHPTNFRSVVDITIGDWLHDVCEIEYPLDDFSTSYQAYPVYGIRMTKNGKPFFEGGFSPDFPWPMGWFDKNGEFAVMEAGVISVTYGGQDPWKNYETSPALFARLALKPELTSRGDLGIYGILLFSALLLTFVVAFPDAVFALRYQRYVRNPEPTEYYMKSMLFTTIFLTVVLFIGFCYAAFSLMD